MSDILDKSTRQQEVVMKSLLSVRKEVPDIKPTGRCHYCDEDIEEPKLFCDGDCADDFEKYGSVY